MINYSLGIQESLDKIFGGVLIGAISRDNTKQLDIVTAAGINRHRFISNFPSNIFQDDYAIFYEIMVTLSAKIFTIEELNSIVENNRDLILDSPYVDITKLSSTQTGTAATDDEKIEAVKINLREKLIELSNRYVTTDEFDSACSVFTDWYKNQRMLQVTQAMSRIMSDQGFEEKEPGKRSKLYYGYEDVKTYYNKHMRVLNELESEESRVRSLILNKDWLDSEMQSEDKEDDGAILRIGLTEIDTVLGDLRRGNIVSILGPPKGGKTRFTNFLVNTALASGLNVAVWTLEGTPEEWIAMQLAALIRRDTGIAFNSKDILQRKYTSKKEDRELVVAAKLRLAMDPNIGRLSFIESTAYIEDFLDILKAHYENDNPFDVIVIDQLIDIMSRTGRGKVDRISSAYIELKTFLTRKMRTPALAIIPAQLKQEVVDYLRKNPNETIDVTAGGESAETVRSADEVIGLFSSKEERAANQMHVYSVASRHSENFSDFRARADLKCCHLWSDPTLS